MPSNDDPLQKSDVDTLINFFSQRSGFQRSNRYRVKITPPITLKFSSSKISPSVLYASYIQIPQQVITYYPDTVSPSGPMVDVPLKRDYDDRFIIDFIVDKKWETRKFFEEWMNFMFVDAKSSLSGTSVTNKYTSSYVKYYSEITGKVEITPLDTASNINQKITLYDAFPATLVSSEMSGAIPDDYLVLSVDMNYRYYRTSDT